MCLSSFVSSFQLKKVKLGVIRTEDKGKENAISTTTMIIHCHLPTTLYKHYRCFLKGEVIVVLVIIFLHDLSEVTSMLCFSCEMSRNKAKMF